MTLSYGSHDHEQLSALSAHQLLVATVTGLSGGESSLPSLKGQNTSKTQTRTKTQLTRMPKVSTSQAVPGVTQVTKEKPLQEISTLNSVS